MKEEALPFRAMVVHDIYWLDNLPIDYIKKIFMLFNNEIFWLIISWWLTDTVVGDRIYEFVIEKDLEIRLILNI